MRDKDTNVSLMVRSRELTCLTNIEILLTVGHIEATVPAEAVVGGVVLPPGPLAVPAVSLRLTMTSLDVVNSVVNLAHTAA